MKKKRIRVGVAVLLFCYGVGTEILAWVKPELAKNVTYVTHLSTWALVFAGLIALLEVS